MILRSFFALLLLALPSVAAAQSPIAPWYFSRDDYMAIRGGEPQPVLILEYDIYEDDIGPEPAEDFASLLDGIDAALNPDATEDLNSEDASGPVSPLPEPTGSVILMLGPDFAYIVRDDTNRVYDFRMKRIIDFDRTDYSFRNQSAYAQLYRDILTVRNLTGDGTVREIPLGGDQTLAAYWLEAALGWQAGEAAESWTQVTELEDGAVRLDAEYKGQPSFYAVSAANESEGAPARPDATAFMDSYYRLMAWHLPVHPDVLSELKQQSFLPEQLFLFTLNPTNPAGRSEVWQLKRAVTFEHIFPLYPGLTAQDEHPDLKPARAALLRPDTYRPKNTPEKVQSDIESYMAEGELVAAWLRAQDYLIASGDCRDKADSEAVCDLIIKIENDGAYSAPFNSFKTAWMASGEQAAGELLYTLRRLDNPPLVLQKRVAAYLMSLPTDQRENTGIDTRALLLDIMERDAADPRSYASLAQLYSEQQDFVRAWDIHDLIRSALPAARVTKSVADESEAALDESAPQHF